MSLINDALKRAKQAQQPNSPDAPHMRVQFRPVEPTQQAKKSNAWIWIAAVLFVALVVLGIFVHQANRSGSSAPDEAKAREIVPAKPTRQEIAQPTPSAAATTTSPSSTTAVTTAQVAKSVAPPAASPVILQEEPAAKFTPKLQAVVYHPTRPSAIVSGKSVFVGDRVGDFRVTRITQESVTLVGGGQTNVLVLGE